METSAQDKDDAKEKASGEPTEAKAAEAKDQAPADEGASKATAAADEPAEAEEESDEASAGTTKDGEDEGESKESGEKKARPRAKVTAVRKGVRGPGAARVAAAPKKSGSLGKSLILFLIIVGGLAAGFAILGEKGPSAPEKPKWSTNQVVDVDVTLVPTDKENLGCASAEEIGSKRCGFDGAQKPRSGGDDTSTYKPYTTVDRIQFVGSGLWASLASANLPTTRFTVKCKLKVEGTLKKLDVRWNTTDQWWPHTEWYAGALSDCKIAP